MTQVTWHEVVPSVWAARVDARLGGLLVATPCEGVDVPTFVDAAASYGRPTAFPTRVGRVDLEWCKACARPFPSRAAKREHAREAHSRRPGWMPARANGVRAYWCRRCKVPFGSKRMRREHWELHHRGETLEPAEAAAKATLRERAEELNRALPGY